MSVLELSTTFDRTTALTIDEDDSRISYSMLDESWSSLRGIHGGYLTALAVRAAEAQLKGRAVRSITMSFMRPGSIGQAKLSTSTVREGRNLTTVAVTIEQEGIVAVARVTAASDGIEGTGWEQPRRLDLRPIEACVPLYPPDGVRHFEQADALLDPRGIPFTHGNEAQLGGYVRPREERQIDAAWLAMILDWFPPCSFVMHDPPTGGVSVDYTVHLHRTLDRLAPDEWLAARFEAPISQGGLALEHGIVVGPAGEALAESFHTRWSA